MLKKILFVSLATLALIHVASGTILAAPQEALRADCVAHLADREVRLDSRCIYEELIHREDTINPDETDDLMHREDTINPDEEVGGERDRDPVREPYPEAEPELDDPLAENPEEEVIDDSTFDEVEEALEDSIEPEEVAEIEDELDEEILAGEPIFIQGGGSGCALTQAAPTNDLGGIAGLLFGAIFLLFIVRRRSSQRFVRASLVLFAIAALAMGCSNSSTGPSDPGPVSGPEIVDPEIPSVDEADPEAAETDTPPSVEDEIETEEEDVEPEEEGSAEIDPEAGEEAEEEESYTELTVPNLLGTMHVILPQLVPGTEDGAAFDRFGYAIASSGNTVIVGAPRDDDNHWGGIGNNSGAVYIYERRTNGSWNRQKIDLASDYNDRFGYSVAISGNRAIVGVPGDDENGTDSGAAYILERDAAGNWNSLRIKTNNPIARAAFGHAVAISGNFAVVGAPNEDSDAAIDTGAIYTFERQAPGAWEQEQKLTARDDAAAGDVFGQAVAISGDYLVAGAPSNRASEAGKAYLFRRGDIEIPVTCPEGEEYDEHGNRNYCYPGALITGWIREHKFDESLSSIASEISTGDRFGSAVAVDSRSHIIAIGAPYDDPTGHNSGAVYISSWRPHISGNPEQAHFNNTVRLDAGETGYAHAHFGTSVAVERGHVLVGAPLATTEHGEEMGAVYLFERDSSPWLLSETLTADSNGETDDHFGHTVTMSDDRIAVGAYRADSEVEDSGTVYLFHNR